MNCGSVYGIVKHLLPEETTDSAVTLVSSLMLTGVLMRSVGAAANYKKLMASYDKKVGLPLGTCRKRLRAELSGGNYDVSLPICEYLRNLENAVWEELLGEN